MGRRAKPTKKVLIETFFRWSQDVPGCQATRNQVSQIPVGMLRSRYYKGRYPERCWEHKGNQQKAVRELFGKNGIYDQIMAKRKAAKEVRAAP